MAPDIDAARSFYKAVFGWEYDVGGPEFGGYTTARLGNRMTAGLMGPQADAPPMPAAWGLYFASDNIEADVARAVELGAKVVSPAMCGGRLWQHGGL
jgi:predicted enzyme related to lactoylglutathione lyase